VNTGSGEGAVLTVPECSCYATDGVVPATGRPARSAQGRPYDEGLSPAKS
jgi:hypothetical protein